LFLNGADKAVSSSLVVDTYLSKRSAHDSAHDSGDGIGHARTDLPANAGPLHLPIRNPRHRIMTVKRLLPSLLASTLLLSAGHALAGTDLSVTGRIQSGACSIALGNGGTIDLGTISRKDLKETEETFLARPRVTLAIDCQTPAKVAIKAINNRENVVGDYGQTDYGLGPAGSKSQSYFYFLPYERFGDGKPLLHLYSENGGQSWEAIGPANTAARMNPSRLTAWAEEGKLPQAFRTIRSTLSVPIFVPAARDLDLSQEINLDGSATLELIYL